MEESKAQDLGKLQAALLEMGQQVETMGAHILRERETNKMLSSQLANLVKVRPTLEASEAKNQKLMKENEQLRVWMM